ncbi:PilN domain-containing protein [Candidatus Nomurabacteria bacterium]|nr:PilN domain-containing protein [Candidatus Nomurabacteria bacterium]
MIKINLLPVRASKKKETAIQQIIVLCVSVSIVAVVVFVLYGVKLGQISSTKNDISTSNIKINELKTKIGKLEELKKFKEQVKKKLDLLTQLRKNKSGPAQRLATLSDITPDKLWITSYAENNESVKLVGLAASEDLIAQYMRSIQASNDYTGVELIVSEQREISGVKLKNFELSFKLKSQPAPEASAADKPQK